MKSFPIPADPNNTNPRKRFLQTVTVILEDAIANDFTVSDAEFPQNLPAQWQDPQDKRWKAVTWVSNFRLDKVNPAAQARTLKDYSIELDEGQGQLVYFDGSIVKPLPSQSAGSNRVRAILQALDPPIGWVK